ncbi:hypothetical protein EU508_10685 [Pseudoalteromonas fuliginea]|uniref:ApeI dehydratase-like domain-containing protein n=1 Tax=Pseudoalteromonas fuliginea TaxID=1872678 RepID=A0AB73BGV0_9GAMM|nr:hypothetical protein [Pseudoalteromonas fuliginea]KAA1160206.1 hypothetical protein EU508_10685 [Pseudoalteromonas fuliginea]
MNFERFKFLQRIDVSDKQTQQLKSLIEIPNHSPILDEHFPGHPIVPGVLLIEMMAQSAGNLVLYKSDFSHMAILAAVSHSKFVNYVVPGDRLTCEVELLSFSCGFALCEAQILKDNSLVACAELRMKVVDFFNEQVKNAVVSNFKAIANTLQPAL